MHIGIDISQIIYKGTGVARFTEGFVHSILEFDRRNHWTFFFSSLSHTIDPKLEKQMKDNGHQIIDWKIPASMLSIMWNDAHRFFPFRTSFDWFITSDWTEPKMNVKKATIVHDLVFKRYPATVHPTILRTQQKRLEHVSRESSVIFTDSESTANDLKEFYPDIKGKIVVNYPGVNRNGETHHDVSLKNKYQITKPYILSVGKLEPRKNIQRLIDAFLKINPDAQLIIVGPSGWGDGLQGHDDKIKLIGFVSDEELAELYKSATCFFYPSLYEGFGYPIIEAMKHGCPVATSDTSSLAEICDDAALLFDPQNVDEIADAINQLMTDEKLRSSLSEKGKKHAELFTWEQYYNRFITSLNL